MIVNVIQSMKTEFRKVIKSPLLNIDANSVLQDKIDKTISLH